MGLNYEMLKLLKDLEFRDLPTLWNLLTKGTYHWQYSQKQDILDTSGFGSIISWTMEVNFSQSDTEAQVQANEQCLWRINFHLHLNETHWISDSFL